MQETNTIQQESSSNSSNNSRYSLLNVAMNSANSKREMEGNRGMISPESIRLNQEDRDTSDDSPNQWQKHKDKSGNFYLPIERKK